MAVATVTAAEMAALEENAAYLGVPRSLMMENAGRSVAEAVAKLAKRGSRVLVVAHTGNKGGDGFAAARHLASMGFLVTVVLVGDPATIRTEEARANWRALESMERSVQLATARCPASLKDVFSELGAFDVVIDALLGTGVKGLLKEPVLTAVKLVNSMEPRPKVISIDLPTGIDPDTGEVLGAAVRADVTVTMHAVKRGLLASSAKEYVGDVEVAPIGIPPEAGFFAGPGDVRLAVKPRRPEARKGDFGRVLVVGGSSTYSGAPALAAMAALRAGVDLAYVAAPSSVANAIRSYSPNLIVRTLPSDRLSPEALEAVTDLFKRADVVIVGSGAGLSQAAKEACLSAISRAVSLGRGVVVDADGLKALADKRELIRGARAILTPHAGEFKILTGAELPEGWRGRVPVVKERAAELGATILLKGHYDIISDGKRVKVNRTGTPAMTVGGTGDVLSGIAAAFLAWGADPFRAAVAAAFVNGLAGERAAEEKGFHIVATDLLEVLPAVMREFDALA